MLATAIFCLAWLIEHVVTILALRPMEHTANATVDVSSMLRKNFTVAFTIFTTFAMCFRKQGFSGVGEALLFERAASSAADANGNTVCTSNCKVRRTSITICCQYSACLMLRDILVQRSVCNSVCAQHLEILDSQVYDPEKRGCHAELCVCRDGIMAITLPNL